MLAKILLYLGALLPFVWGIAHLFPTRNVVAGFGVLSDDNRQIITMEWILEGVSLIFVGILVAAMTLLGGDTPLAGVVYFLSAGFLLVLAGISLFTGFKVNFFPFKLCPFLFTTAAVLILIGSFV